MSTYPTYSSGGNYSKKKSKWDQPPKEAQLQVQFYEHPNNLRPFEACRSSSLPQFIKTAEYAYSHRNDYISQKKDNAKDNPKGSKEEILPQEMEEMVSTIMAKFKSKGMFDRFRRECLNDIDTKPAFINLTNRVKLLVDNYLKKTKWTPTLSKVRTRETMRRSMTEARFFDTGVDRVVDQVVNPKINSLFCPLVEAEVYNFLGIKMPKDPDEDDPDEEIDVGSDDYLSETIKASRDGKYDLSSEKMKLRKEMCYTSQSEPKICYESKLGGPWIPDHDIKKCPECSSFLSPKCFQTEELERKGSPKNLATPGLILHGEEYTSNLSENSNCSSDYGFAHTPEEEYDENLIREKENSYLNSIDWDSADYSKVADEGASEEKPINNESFLEQENDEQCKDVSDLTTEEESEEAEEEESPPFEKIGESPPPSPIHGNQTKTVISKHISLSDTDNVKHYHYLVQEENHGVNGTANKSSAELELSSISKACFIDTALVALERESGSVEKETNSLEDNAQPLPTGEDIEEDPVYFLDPIPSLMEKSEFYLQFRNHIKKNGKTPVAAENPKNDEVKV